jgi:hypothetical protein
LISEDMASLADAWLMGAWLMGATGPETARPLTPSWRIQATRSSRPDIGISPVFKRLESENSTMMVQLCKL